VVVEASPLASFTTAAGHFPRTGRVTLPDDVLRALRSETLYLRVVTRSGDIVATLRKP
jgi:hypothetical protein